MRLLLRLGWRRPSSCTRPVLASRLGEVTYLIGPTQRRRCSSTSKTGLAQRELTTTRCRHCTARPAQGYRKSRLASQAHARARAQRKAAGRCGRIATCKTSWMDSVATRGRLSRCWVRPQRIAPESESATAVQVERGRVFGEALLEPSGSGDDGRRMVDRLIELSSHAFRGHRGRRSQRPPSAGDCALLVYGWLQAFGYATRRCRAATLAGGKKPPPVVRHARRRAGSD